MSAVLRVLALAAPSLSNEVLGQAAADLAKGGLFDGDAGELGRALRPGLVAFDATPAAGETKGDTLPESPLVRSNLLQNIYDSFDRFDRRSVPALSRATGLNRDAVLQLIDGNSDFRVTQGRQSGETFVSLQAQ